jgi:hypothetical protein
VHLIRCFPFRAGNLHLPNLRIIAAACCLLHKEQLASAGPLIVKARDSDGLCALVSFGAWPGVLKASRVVGAAVKLGIAAARCAAYN